VFFYLSFFRRELPGIYSVLVFLDLAGALRKEMFYSSCQSREQVCCFFPLDLRLRLTFTGGFFFLCMGEVLTIVHYF